MQRILTLEFVRVTEAAAMAASHAIGHGNKNQADGLAVKAMREVFSEIDIAGTVVIGEGELDEAPMLYTGEKVGLASPDAPPVDIAVDPLEGTSLVAKGMAGAIAVIAVADKGGLLAAPDMYMDKIAVGPQARGTISLEKSPTENLRAVAEALHKKIEDLAVVVLDRPRHAELIKELRAAGAMIRLITDGDVLPAVATAFPEAGIDMVMGTGGAPEGVLAAAALKCVGGDMCGRLNPEITNSEMCRDLCLKVDCKHLTLNDLAPGSDIIFSMTGITESSLLKGITYSGNNMINTHTLALRSRTGTIRFIEASRNIEAKLRWNKNME